MNRRSIVCAAMRIGSPRRPDDLHRYRDAQLCVPRLIDGAHAANAEDSDDVIASPKFWPARESVAGLTGVESVSPPVHWRQPGRISLHQGIRYVSGDELGASEAPQSGHDPPSVDVWHTGQIVTGVSKADGTGPATRRILSQPKGRHGLAGSPWLELGSLERWAGSGIVPLPDVPNHAFAVPFTIGEPNSQIAARAQRHFRNLQHRIVGQQDAAGPQHRGDRGQRQRLLERVVVDEHVGREHEIELSPSGRSNRSDTMLASSGWMRRTIAGRHRDAARADAWHDARRPHGERRPDPVAGALPVAAASSVQPAWIPGQDEAIGCAVVAPHARKVPVDARADVERRDRSALLVARPQRSRLSASVKG